MSTGVLIYNFDTPTINYSRITRHCVSYIKKYLDLPITIVSYKNFENLNTVIVDPQKNNQRRYNRETHPWYNQERTGAFDHSPYDTTILMDCDYFVMSDYLLRLANTVNDVLLHTKINDITKRNNIVHSREALIPLVWATVVVFKKNNFTKKLFDLIKNIQKNYYYYRMLYRIKPTSYRNDYAFAIALHQLYGNCKENYSIPTAMNMIGTDSKILDMTDNSLTFSWKNQYSILCDQDVHVFNKEIFDV